MGGWRDGFGLLLYGAWWRDFFGAGGSWELGVFCPFFGAVRERLVNCIVRGAEWYFWCLTFFCFSVAMVRC
jgi:hypothetical protein